MTISDFDFELPESCIALRPASPRDSARLLEVGSAGGLLDRKVTDLPSLLRPGDGIVFNDTRVIPARLEGRRLREGASAAVEATLHKRLTPSRWAALMRPGRRLRPGDRITFQKASQHSNATDFLEATVVAKGARTGRLIWSSMRAVKTSITRWSSSAQCRSRRTSPLGDRATTRTGSTTKPYMRKNQGRWRRRLRSLHFTPSLLHRLAERGVSAHFVTLHVGAGTFLPIKTDLSDHQMHPEYGEVSEKAAAALTDVRRSGGRIICVGTTSLRLLESAATSDGQFGPFAGETSIFITPGYRFQAADGLMTNFSSAPVNTLRAGIRIQRPIRYARGLCPRHRHGVSILFLWRRQPSLARSLVAAIPFTIGGAETERARTGSLQTPRGAINTPAFMPVGTAATVKALTVDQVVGSGAQIILGNTYHLMLRPTAERVARLGGLHKFMRWDGPILTEFRRFSGDGVPGQHRQCR